MPTRSSRVARIEAVAVGVGAGIALIAIWHVAVILSRTQIVPSPKLVAKGIVVLARRGLLVAYIRDSLLRVAVGFSLATVMGLPLGVLMGRSSQLAAALNPVIQVLRPISPLAWIPLAVVFFGVTNLAAIFLIFLASFLSITMAAMNAVRNVPVIYVRAGRNFGLTRSELMWRIIMPAALPQILATLRLALGIAWIVVVAAEMIAIDSGLGYLIVDARNAGKRYDLVVGGMILIGLVGLVLDTMVRRVEHLRPVRWGFRND